MTSVNTDQILIGAAARGEVAAFDALVRRHYPVAIAAARSFGAGDEADDIVQVAFVNVFANLHRFELGRPFRPWLVKIVINECSHYRRSRGRREALAARSSPVAASPNDVVEDAVALTLVQEQLLQAVASLKHRDRMVVVCRYLLDLTEQETAEILGCPPGTVKSRLSRALERLRNSLRKGGRP